jgi:putative zinc finger/helix-turn-helix YgiT family protein
MKTKELFEFACPECGEGKVRTTRVFNYKTKIKGYPITVDEALIGVCDRCGSESFAPEETKRWEELFYRSLEDRHAFLAPQEITELRTALGLSMEDFARLIGCTRQSISAWEKPARTSLPSRMADLLMKLVQKSQKMGAVDVLSFLIDEARKWGVVIEMRQSSVLSTSNGSLVLSTKRMPNSALAEENSSLALAAAAVGQEGDRVAVETSDGRLIGLLDYDFVQATLSLKLTTAEFPPWQAVDVEIETQGGQRFTRQNVVVRERCLILLEEISIQEEDVAQITLKAPHQATRS